MTTDPFPRSRTAGDQPGHWLWSDGEQSRPATRPATTTAHTGRGARRVGWFLRASCLVAALAGALGVVATWRFFVATLLGQQLDDLAFQGAEHGRTELWRLAEPVLDVVSVGFVVVGVSVAMGIALIRRRWPLAIQVAVLVLGANLTTQVLKKFVLDRPRLGFSDFGNSLPSGHTTVAASVSVALVLTLPRRGRAAAAILGAAYTAATGISTLVGQWHRPSDVIAGLCVVLFWGAAVSAFATSSTLDPVRNKPVHPTDGVSATRWVVTLLAVAAVATGAVAAWALARTADVIETGVATTHRTELIAYLGGACGVVAVTAVLVAVLLALRQAVADPR
ncbi:phosphatase PAP2 family protein [Sanguibacter suaedae]|uniref:phosphatase PAP2 family protein n=1 Tax=Sanguibacter suaedae TaxID=2795737 RepID=UPI0027DBC7C4|nr:phosphatase PAP2 family protein [Sanguibacter suaedae]